MKELSNGRPSGLSSDDGAASVSTLRASIPDAEETLHDIADAIGGMAAWAEGKTLSVIVQRDPLCIAKLRFAGFAGKPSTADLRGEPE